MSIDRLTNWPSLREERSLGRAHRLVTENSKAFVVVGLLLWPSWSLGEGPYVAYSTFQQWVRLMPEVQSLEVCGLTDAAHKLWAQDQLRVPATTFMQGDFGGIGITDWIVQLHQSTSSRPCDYLLIVSHNKDSWEQLFFSEIRPNKVQGWMPLWYSKKRVIATMSVSTEEDQLHMDRGWARYVRRHYRERARNISSSLR